MAEYIPPDIFYPTPDNTPFSLPVFGMNTDIYTSTDGTYVCSSSSLRDSNKAVNAFSISAGWESADNNYEGTTGVYIGTTKTNVKGVGDVFGEWVQIQFPFQLAVEQYCIYNIDTTSANIFYIVGSNDGSNWDVIDYRTGIVTNAVTAYSFNTQQKTPYSFYRLIGTKNNGTTSTTTFLAIDNLFFQGTKLKKNLPIFNRADFFEPNIREPNGIITKTVSPTPITGINANTYTYYGTWIASGSSVNGASGNYWNAFDNNTNTFWPCAAFRYSNGVYTGTTSTTISGVGAVLGEWLQIQMPYSFALTQYTLQVRTGLGMRMPRIFYIVGSTDGTTWVQVDYRTYTDNTTGLTTLTNTVSGSGTYNYYRLITNAVYQGTNGNYVEITEWKMTGTIEGTSQLKRTPDPYNFSTPIYGMNANTFIQTNAFASETYEASSSSFFDANTNAFYAFNQNFYRITVGGGQIITVSNQWTPFYDSVGGIYPYAFSGEYTGDTTYYSTTIGGVGTVGGEWLQMKFPVPFKLTYYGLSTYLNIAADKKNLPKTYYIVGSNDGTTWINLEYRTIATSAESVGFSISNTNYYTYYRLVITEAFLLSGIPQVRQWTLMGDRQTPLVPFYLNTDPTLTLYYPFDNNFAGEELWNYNKYFVDKSITNNISSTSGTYSITTANKAIGTSSLYLAPIGIVNVAQQQIQANKFSISCWTRISTIISASGSAERRFFAIDFGFSRFIFLACAANLHLFIAGGGYGQAFFNSTTAPPNTWLHWALVIDETIQTIYLNGNAVSTQTINPPTGNLYTQSVRIGNSSTTTLFDTYIDDYRFYNNKALNGDEVRALYNYRGYLTPYP